MLRRSVQGADDMGNPLKKLFSGLMALIIGGVFLWQAVASQHRNARLEANPHENAFVERTWTTSGKSSARYADLRFAKTGGLGVCRVSGVRLGGVSVPARAGGAVDIAPIPGSCDAPDVASARESGWFVATQFALSFAVFAGSMFAITGVPAPMSRRRI